MDKMIGKSVETYKSGLSFIGYGGPPVTRLELGGYSPRVWRELCHRQSLGKRDS